MYIIDISPLANEDLLNIKKYIANNFSEELSLKVLREIVDTLRKFEKYPLMGRPLTNLIDVHSDYYYYVVGKNYVFYRIEGTTIKIIRVIDTRRDFVQALFGVEL